MLSDMLRFIVDTQLPPSLAIFLKRRGFEATHVVEYPSGALTPDNEIISIAKKENRIIISKDIDFFDYYLLKSYPPAILLLQLGNTTNRDLFIFMDNNLDAICELFAENIRRLVLINRHRIIIY
jgi:predicted nuclease of predicted toxin-antitoxin system